MILPKLRKINKNNCVCLDGKFYLLSIEIINGRIIEIFEIEGKLYGYIDSQLFELKEKK
jgi:hypothetical protein